MNKHCQTIIFSDNAYNAIIDETFRKDPIETGGILLGHVLDNGIWVVLEVIPPGINSIHQYAYFEYDTNFVNYLAESVATKYEEKLELLGLWHRHPGNMDFFSGTDDNTNRTFAKLRPCGAISGLVNVDPNFRLTMRHVSSSLNYEIIDVEVGNDLIPEKFFKLRHYPQKGLNPPLDNEKKNDWKIIENELEPESETNQYISPKKFKATTLGLTAIFTFILFVILSFAQQSIDKNREKEQSLYEIVYNDSFDIKKDIHTSDRTVESKLDFNKENSKVSYCLLGICGSLIVLIFFPINKKLFKYQILSSGAIALIIVFLSQKSFSIASTVFFALYTILLLILSYGILWSVHQIIIYIKLPWFRTKKKLLQFEDEGINQVEPNSVQSIEGDSLVYTIITQQEIKSELQQIAFQLIYSPKYNKDGIISLYMISPEFKNIINSEDSSLSQYAKYDNFGDGYFEFNVKDEDSNITCGGDIISLLYANLATIYN